ncbi:asparagine synthase (glutamine-hydrolyzing) [Kibdelosporangium philippinense]|uniref:asparagine synthase (glutamine-hydrolyzing) n=1 Tax=Kibdelosporangium philippinense TaxID=211113 RepID=A0ABS8Z176_9PSEU|nr:asparagine synthase (glutamine-hydrolyzing) [Kibdelosporangium philippinense]MCE7001515.1 asparagine synthase (glutamine-hydrolyzing) [Kibdelosporangium philippinense]
MCGIAGWVSYTADLTTRRSVVDDMTATMSCRGPDASGTWIRRHVGLGHCRLAIIDLPGGQQPMTVDTPRGAVTLVYSGETYNFTELRRALEGLGHKFRTSSDTEVVLHAYLEWDAGLASRLNGMYAFAIWDERDQKLVMVRDRLGIKPFYYYPTPDGVLFGSEPKAILANPDVPRIVDMDGLRELVAFTQAPRWALWKGMYEVEPGQILTVSRAGITARTYWRLEPKPHSDSLEDTVGNVRELLTDIVERQLVADVPRCVLLSGGLDSSAITGLASSFLGSELRTFSVDFIGREETFRADEARDTPDTPFIRDVVSMVNSQHKFVTLSSALLCDPGLRRKVIAARDMPIGFGEMDTSLYLLFESIRAESTVALSGESADEVFGGYRWFHDPFVVGTDNFPWLVYQSAMSGDRAALMCPHLRGHLDIPGYMAAQYSDAVAAVEHLDSDSDFERRMRTISYLHLTRFVRMMLDRKDRISMAVGLEVRVPFCDHRLVEYVYNAPWALKSFDGREKSLLRHATSHVVPGSVQNRLKASYPSTQDPRYNTELQSQVKEVLADRDHLAMSLIDWDWLTDAIAMDPASMPSNVRRGIDRILDLYHWADMYNPIIDRPD